MAKLIYTAEALVTGGRSDGQGRTPDGELEVQLRPPAEGGGTNPEQLFAVGYAACFAEALKAIGRRHKTEVGDVSIDAKVKLLTTEERGFNLAVALDISLPAVEDIDTAKELVSATHRVCPYSNATRGNIEVELGVNGQAVA